MFDVLGIDDNGDPRSCPSRDIDIESQPNVDAATAKTIPKERRA